MDTDAGGEGHGSIVPGWRPRPQSVPPGGHAYIVEPPTASQDTKGSGMSDDTEAGELVLTPPARNYSPWYQWMTRLNAVTHEDPLPEGDPAAFAPWLERRRRVLAELLGPEPEPVPLDLEMLESTRCDGYRRDKVVFDTEDTMSVPAYLLVPDSRAEGPPGAAVLACHGHGPGKSQAVGLEHTAMPNADYALQLARRGYVVLAPDLRCFGERLDWMPEDHYACDTNLVHATMAGWNPLGQNVWDLRRCLDVLDRHELVDPGRIGMVGISYGGTVTLFTAALDDRVAAAVVSGYFSSWAESHKMPWNMCGSQVMAGMLGRLEHEDLGALVAPRPLLIESGTEDYLFPVATATESVRRTRLVYDHLAVRATAWCTTSSRVSTSGTGPRRCPSWTAGSAHDRRDVIAQFGGSPGCRSRPRRTWSGCTRLVVIAPLPVPGVPGCGGAPQQLVERGRRPRPRRRPPSASARGRRKAPPLQEAAQDRREGRSQDHPALRIPRGRDLDRVCRGDVHEGEDGGDRGAGSEVDV